ncbi:MAG: hypothetical protein CO093_08755 [Alphaproteobacteria bacterium CG_4_9_14_3_um_filter_47_13]|nr:MAG: hypothetical protein CO093_08755 [Alphaproteobacteria bacterium CG_4_9_14_3_um_filter_47_13]
MEGASLLLDTRPFIEDSDENGFVSEIANSQNDYTRLRFQENSTDNPFHASSLEGYRLLLRSGVSQHIDFALVETGIVDGTAYFDNGNPVPGLKLQLLDRTGKVVKETITGFDGFYTFEFVKPGQYAIRPDPLLDITVPTKLVSVSQDAPFAYGLNVKLLDKAGLPPSPVQVDPDKAQRNIGSVIGALARLQDTLKNAAGADGS